MNSGKGYDTMTDLELIQLANGARKNAYAPYSNYTVGAALLLKSGEVVLGCNVENASFGATVCAERAAVSAAIAKGARDFCAIAVVGGKAGEPAATFFSPCGICRQTLREFCNDDFRVLVGCGNEIRAFRLGELLPAGFGAETMEKSL